MRRRDFITLFGSTAATRLLTSAQQPSKMKRIAFVATSVKVSEISLSGGPYYRALAHADEVIK